jgi:hypothetical protein
MHELPMFACPMLVEDECQADVESLERCVQQRRKADGQPAE